CRAGHLRALQAARVFHEHQYPHRPDPGRGGAALGRAAAAVRRRHHRSCTATGARHGAACSDGIARGQCARLRRRISPDALARAGLSSLGAVPHRENGHGGQADGSAGSPGPRLPIMTQTPTNQPPQPTAQTGVATDAARSPQDTATTIQPDTGPPKTIKPRPRTVAVMLVVLLVGVLLVLWAWRLGPFDTAVVATDYSYVRG